MATELEKSFVECLTAMHKLDPEAQQQAQALLMSVHRHVALCQLHSPLTLVGREAAITADRVAKLHGFADLRELAREAQKEYGKDSSDGE